MTSPIEAGLGWITKTKKGNFVGCELFSQQLLSGTTRKLVGFELSDRRVPRQGYDIVNEKGEKIGRVTSGTSSPTLDRPIGLGYVDKPFDAVGSTVYIVFGGGKQLAATVTKPPFLT